MPDAVDRSGAIPSGIARIWVFRHLSAAERRRQSTLASPLPRRTTWLTVKSALLGVKPVVEDSNVQSGTEIGEHGRHTVRERSTSDLLARQAPRRFTAQVHNAKALQNQREILRFFRRGVSDMRAIRKMATTTAVNIAEAAMRAANRQFIPSMLVDRPHWALADL
jgi:hypothetical protein